MALSDDGPCVFCKIVQGEVPAFVLHEDEHCMAFLDIAPVTKGHTLVVPRRHSKDLLSTDVKTLRAMVGAIHVVAAAVQTATGVSGFNILQNNGAVAGQVVGHLHFHIIPRYSNDALMSKRIKRPALKEKEAEDLTKRIRKACL